MLICSICETENEDEVATCILCGALLVEQFKTRPPEPQEEVQGDPSESLDTYLAHSQDSLDLGLHAPAEDLFVNVSGDFLLPSDDSFNAVRVVDEDTPTQDDIMAFGGGFVEESHVQAPSSVAYPASPDSLPMLSTNPAWQEESPVPELATAPATHALIVYYQRQPALEFPISLDKILIGRIDPATQNYPELDLTPYDPESAISRKHMYLTQEDGRFFVLPISSAGTQINRKLLAIGNKVELVDGDVIVLSGRIAMRFVRL